MSYYVNPKYYGYQIGNEVIISLVDNRKNINSSIDRADKVLYEAKSSGMNKICISQD